MIQIGETPNCQINKAATIGMIIVLRVSFTERAVVRQGTAIRATTAGRNPLNIFSTHILSWNCVKNSAMARIIVKEGRIVPKAQTILPGIPFNCTLQK